MAAPMAEVDPSAVLDAADPDATTDHRPPCRCCGGRMSLSRSLRAAPHRAARPRVVPGPGLRHHDDRGHFITRREMPLPVLQPRCLRAAEHSRCIARHTNTALPISPSPSLRPLQLAACALLRRPSHHSRKPPRRQIAIDDDRHVAPRVLSLEAFGRRPQNALIRLRWAGIRYPAHEPATGSTVVNGSFGGRHQTFESGAKILRATAKSKSPTCGVFGVSSAFVLIPRGRALKPGYLMPASLAVVGGLFG